MVAMMPVTVVPVAAVPIIGPIIVVTPIRPVVPVRIISVARAEPNAEEHLSIRTWRRSKG
jgi:hypothetical protein